MTEPAFRKLTEDEYLRLLEKSDTRYEFIDGFVYAQAGATENHNLIAMNLAVQLHAPARKSGCKVFQNDMRLVIEPPRVPARTQYFPDIMVSCQPASRDGLYHTDPCLLVEIQSKSTELMDKSQKWRDYQALPSLQAYLMVDSLSRSAAIYRRTQSGWAYSEVSEVVTLPCPEVTLNFADIYEGTNI